MLVSDTMSPAFGKVWWGVMYFVYSIIVLGLIWVIPSFKRKSESSNGKVVVRGTCSFDRNGAPAIFQQ